MLAKKVWESFRSKRVFENGYIEKKGRYSYLAWHAAQEILNDDFPDNTVEFSMYKHPSGYETCAMYYPDGTAEVNCTITIREDGESFSRSMFLPVKDHKHKSIVNPNSMAINTAKQRCVVKCLAMMGLGLHVYMGAEDDPEYVMTGLDKVRGFCSELSVSEDKLNQYVKSVANGSSIYEIADRENGDIDSLLLYLKDKVEEINNQENNKLEDQQ
jgi:hypothetical protein